MKTAVSNIAWRPENRGDAYRLLSSSGIRGIEVAPGLLLHDADDVFRPSDAVRRRALSEIDDHGFHLVSMQSLLFGTRGAELFGDDAARSAFMQGMERAVDLAEILGIPNLVFGSPKQRVVPAGMSLDEAEKIAANVFHRLGDRALRAGTQISLEPTPTIYDTNFLTTLSDTIAFATYLDHPAIRITVDLGALHATAEMGRMSRLLEAQGQMIGHVHLSAPWLLPPEETSAEISEYVRVLSACGYAGPISLEMKEPEGGLAALAPVVSRLAIGRRQ